MSGLGHMLSELFNKAAHEVKHIQGKMKQVHGCNQVSLCLKSGEKLITSPNNNLHLHKRKPNRPHIIRVGVCSAERVLMDGEALFWIIDEGSDLFPWLNL